MPQPKSGRCQVHTSILRRQVEPGDNLLVTLHLGREGRTELIRRGADGLAAKCLEHIPNFRVCSAARA